MRHETPTSLRIQKARTSLILDHPFFGSLLFRLKGRECRSVQTMATDGVSLFYNPDFVETLNAATLAGTLAHEVMHPALHHHVRRSGRDPKLWNQACDFAINPLLVDAGLSLPDGVLTESSTTWFGTNRSMAGAYENWGRDSVGTDLEIFPRSNSRPELFVRGRRSKIRAAN
jgi:predicted metal-dependent peptidase